jgi:hypothetical protein
MAAGILKLRIDHLEWPDDYEPREDLVYEQYEEQRKIIETSSTCKITEINADPTLASLIRYSSNSLAVNELLKESFYQEKILQSLLCAAEKLFTPSHTVSSLHYSEKISRWFRELTYVDRGSQGDVYKTKDEPGSKSIPFVIKVSADERIHSIHEAFVGLFGTNQLRDYVPNFAYVFGTFECPNIVEGRCCVGEETRRYVMYENITDSVSANLFFGNPDVSLYHKINVLFQLFSALDLARNLIDFTHYDLHGDNVLVKELKKEVCIPCHNEVVSYIRTRYVPIIIDFGLSHFVYEGKHYGVEFKTWSGKDSGVRMDKSFPLHDIFKFYFRIREELRRTRLPDHIQLVVDIDKYFFSEKIDSSRIEGLVDEIHDRFLSPPFSLSEFPVDHLYLLRIIKEKMPGTVKYFISDTPFQGLELWSCRVAPELWGFGTTSEVWSSDIPDIPDCLEEGKIIAEMLTDRDYTVHGAAELVTEGLPIQEDALTKSVEALEELNLGKTEFLVEQIKDSWKYYSGSILNFTQEYMDYFSNNSEIIAEFVTDFSTSFFKVVYRIFLDFTEVVRVFPLIPEDLHPLIFWRIKELFETLKENIGDLEFSVSQIGNILNIVRPYYEELAEPQQDNYDTILSSYDKMAIGLSEIKNHKLEIENFLTPLNPAESGLDI